MRRVIDKTFTSLSSGTRSNRRSCRRRTCYGPCPSFMTTSTASPPTTLMPSLCPHRKVNFINAVTPWCQNSSKRRGKRSRSWSTTWSVSSWQTRIWTRCGALSLSISLLVFRFASHSSHSFCSPNSQKLFRKDLVNTFYNLHTTQTTPDPSDSGRGRCLLHYRPQGPLQHRYATDRYRNWGWDRREGPSRRHLSVCRSLYVSSEFLDWLP